MNNLLLKAINYAEKGWFVLPLHQPTQNGCSCEKKACQSSGKHPRIKNGIHGATTNKTQIKTWWNQWPEANIGIKTGLESGLLVVDLDERHQGLEAWKTWSQEHCIKAEMIVATGGGLHLYFDPMGIKFKSRVSLLPGIDIRAEGGMVVAPGSLHSSGRYYEWISSSEQRTPPIPDALRDLLFQTSEQKRLKDEEEIRNIRGIEEGSRNSFLTKIGGFLMRDTLEQTVIKKTLSKINETICHPPLQTEEVDKITQSVFRYQENWDPPKDYKPQQNIPDFPAEALTGTVREWIEIQAHHTDVPIDFIAAPFLVAFSSLIGRQAQVAPYPQTQWFEYAHLWGACIGSPGSGKTPSTRKVMDILNRLNHKSRLKYENQLKDLKSKRTNLNLRLNGLKEAAQKAVKNRKPESELQRLFDEITHCERQLEETVITRRRFLVSDATIEKLGIHMAENTNGLLLFRDELFGFIEKLNYREGDRQFCLESWDGKGSFEVDRIGRGTLTIPHLCLSVFGSFQPSNLKKLTDQSSSGDGFLQRFQVLVYPNQKKTWTDKKRPLPTKINEKVEGLFEQALDTTLFNSRKPICFSFEAQEKFDEWRAELEKTIQHEEGLSEDYQSHLSKYRSLLPKISLLLCAMDSMIEEKAFQDISLETTEKALKIVEHLKLHAEKIYNIHQYQLHPGVPILAHKIRQGFVKDGDSYRNLYRKQWAHLKDFKSVDLAAAILEDKNWIRTETLYNNKRVSKVIRLNPQFRGQHEITKS
jgi:putative DNA primase/helicase